MKLVSFVLLIFAASFISPVYAQHCAGGWTRQPVSISQNGRYAELVEIGKTMSLNRLEDHFLIDLVENKKIAEATVDTGKDDYEPNTPYDFARSPFMKRPELKGNPLIDMALVKRKELPVKEIEPNFIEFACAKTGEMQVILSQYERDFTGMELPGFKFEKAEKIGEMIVITVSFGTDEQECDSFDGITLIGVQCPVVHTWAASGTGLTFKLAEDEFSVASPKKAEDPVFWFGAFFRNTVCEPISAETKEKVKTLLALPKPAMESKIKELPVSAGIYAQFNPVSIVGPVLSFEEARKRNISHKDSRFESTIIAHRFAAVKIDQSGWKETNLLEYFDEKEIVQAISSDGFVKKFFEKPDQAKGFNTLRDLTQALQDRMKKKRDAADRSAACKWDAVFDPKALVSAFAFHHIEGDRVAVRIGLEPELPACKDTIKQLGLLLKIPPSLKAPLALAGEFKEGFLMKDLKRVPRLALEYACGSTGPLGRDSFEYWRKQLEQGH